MSFSGSSHTPVVAVLVIGNTTEHGRNCSFGCHRRGKPEDITVPGGSVSCSRDDACPLNHRSSPPRSPGNSGSMYSRT
jgi:hypothetical protein